MIYISNALYLAAAAAGENIDKPLIGWRSVLRLQDFSSSDGENAGILWSPDTYTYWESDPKSASEGTLEFAVDMVNSSGNTVDYIGIVGHNFYENASGVPFSYKVQHSSDGVTWSDTTSSLTIWGDQKALMAYFNPTFAPYFRLLITSVAGTDVTVRISHVRLGRILRLQRKMYVGISPFTHNKRVDKIVTVSDSGRYLGSVAKSTVNLYTINQLDNLASFIRTEVTPFLDHVELIGKPGETNGPPGTFFAAWRPHEYPRELLYCHPPEQIQRPVNQRSNGMVQWQISGEAEA